MNPSKHSYRQPWPKYLTYLPLSMGMIQPDWIYMNHFIEESAEHLVQKSSDSSLSSSSSTPPTIQIHFRARKPATWHD